MYVKGFSDRLRPTQMSQCTNPNFRVSVDYLTKTDIDKQPCQEVFPPSLDAFIAIFTATLSHFSPSLARLTLFLCLQLHSARVSVLQAWKGHDVISSVCFLIDSGSKPGLLRTTSPWWYSP